MPLQFSFSTVRRELQTIKRLAEPLLNPDDLWVLDHFEQSLDGIQRNRVEAQWALPPEHPLRTKECNGGYERRTEKSPKRRGAKTRLHGELTAIWTITPIPESKQSAAPSMFVLTGIASSKFRLVELIDDQRHEYVSWRMELGDRDSPGSFFHVQIGEDDEISPSYQPLPVPRIPCLPITPPLAIEFMLAELFQNLWPDRLGAERELANEWRNIQLERYESFLGWQSKVLRDGSGSVLVDLKHAQPHADLLLGPRGR